MGTGRDDRGGNYNNGANAGVFGGNCNNNRSNANVNNGSRPALPGIRHVCMLSREHAGYRGKGPVPIARRPSGKNPLGCGGGNVKRQHVFNMKQLDNVFDELTSFEWLLDSYKKARIGKRYRPEVLEFTADLDSNLLRIQEQLRDGTFQFGPYRKFWVSLPKRRCVMALPFDSRIAQWAIYRELKPFYRGLMIEDSYACLDGRGTIRAADKLQQWVRYGRDKGWYCLKMDISKYFYRIDHDVLLDILSRRIKDTRLMDTLERIVRDRTERFGLPRFASPEDGQWIADKGMPIGNLTSQTFGNIYLNELDQYCKHQLHIRRYTRYMDDMIALAPDKQTANGWLDDIRGFLLDRLKLDLNSKTGIFPAKRIEYVGRIITADSIRLRKSTVRHIRRYIRTMDTRERERRYHGLLQHVDCSGLYEYIRGGQPL